MASHVSSEVLDAYNGLTDTAWRLFECSDCHPDFHDEESGEEKYAAPFRIVQAVPHDYPRDGLPEHNVDNCPRCGSYLGLMGTRNVRVTTEGA